MAAHRFQRLLEHAAALKPGQYSVDHEGGTDAAVLCCPNCGGYIHLSPARFIARDGLVEQPVACPTATCGWGKVVVLEAFWEEP